MAVGGYFDRVALHYEEPANPRRDGVVAVYFSSDMGLSVGAGEGAIDALRARGVPVMAVNSSALFLRGRDRTFVDGLVADSLRQALARSGASKAALIGSSFGADILDTGIGVLPPDLRQRISSVVLIVPGTEVFFHANPSGVFYTGTPDSNPRSTARLLKGLPVTCIYGTQEDDSLCTTPELSHASQISLSDGHMMLGHYHALAEAAANAALFPPAPMQ
ncbi:virulence factor [Novosphingobium sp. FKTRR1]|uniref:virulence factor n=1 Tax=unclassified Novosphingobium TaxID=2644732 RepID=UPI001CF00BBD|nr:virulence factor [Novosphingobium sp. FKTRR1]